MTSSSTANAVIVASSALTGNIVVNAGGILGVINSLVESTPVPAVSTVTVNGTLLSALTSTSNTVITVNSGGVFVEEGGMHDDGQRTVNSGGGYEGQSDMALGSLSLSNHLNSQQEDLAGNLRLRMESSARLLRSPQEYTNAPSRSYTDGDPQRQSAGTGLPQPTLDLRLISRIRARWRSTYHVIGAGS